MEYLSLEIFNLEGTGSKYAMLPEDVSITITDTSEIFANGDVWSYSFKLNVKANAHIFGSAGDLHGSRLHEQIDHRRARLWVMGVALYLGYLKLGDEVEVDEDGNVSVTFESGQKTFREMIEGMNARDVSVGDVKIGIALNRKRKVDARFSTPFTLSGLAFGGTKTILDDVVFGVDGELENYAYIQRWPKLVMSMGRYVDHDSSRMDIAFDNTNVQSPYDAAHPFCNINICYQKRVMKDGSEQKERGYTLRLGHGTDTITGGDEETRYNNAPNFFLLYWLERLFKDKNVVIQENQMEKVDGLRRVFLANLGCFYEEVDTDNDSDDIPARYGNLSFPLNFITDWGWLYNQDVEEAEHKPRVRIDLLEVAVGESENYTKITSANAAAVQLYLQEYKTNEPKGYWAYATGENYPNVEASQIINSTEAAFGARFLFDRDFTQVRIVLLRNVFQNKETQKIDCEVIKEEKVENSKRGFVMTYGGDEDDTNYNYNDWSRVDSSKSYQEIRDKAVRSMNKVCYYTPNNGNAYRIKIDEEEKVYYPVLVEVGGYNDAKDGDCDGEESTIETVTIPAKPLIMNEVDGNYAVFFSGDMKVPGADNPPMACSIPLKSIDETTRAYPPYYEYNSGQAQERVDQLWREYTEIAAALEQLEQKEGDDVNIFLKIFYECRMRDCLSEIKLIQFVEGKPSVEGYRIHLKGEVFATEHIAVKLQDNYSFSGNDGTPFDKANIGLCFGMMRSSGPDSFIYYDNDITESEGNDYWEGIPGHSVIDHPDTCDNWGNRWDYSDDYITEKANVPTVFANLFLLRNSGYFDTLLQYGVTVVNVPGADGKVYNVLMRLPVSVVQTTTETMVKYAWLYYQGKLHGLTTDKMLEFDATGIGTIYDMELNWNNLIIEIDSSWERFNTLVQLIQYYNGVINVPPVIHNGVSTRYGNFSLKLRAEKPNPNFDPELPETHYDPEHPEANTNPRFQTITDPNLRGRGLADQFYKEYSYWVRNARIVKRTVKIELAQLLSIDKTKRVTIGDVTGFIRKIQYSISNKTGLGLATFEIMYI